MSVVENNINTKHTCILCGSSFSRKTHLTRHIRSHLNQRTYSCTLCGKATFTRKDLLTRHLKRCVLNQDGVHPSRRRACQFCVQRKTKCDLQSPCTKCVVHGRECVYPEAERRTADAGGSGTASRDGLAVFDRPGLVRDGTRDFKPSSVSLQISTADTSCDSSLSLFTETVPECMVPLSDAADPTVIPSAVSSSQMKMAARPLDQCIAGPTYPSEIISEPIVSSDLLAPPSTSEPFIDINSAFLDYFLNQAAGSTPSLPPEGVPQSPLSVPRPFSPADGSLTDAQPPGIDKYLKYFFTFQCRHYPLLHIPTWSQSAAPPVLKRVMRACGALYATGNDVEGRAADQFISDTLKSGLREQIFRSFTQTPGNDIDTQAALILAMSSMQGLGLFHRSSDERSLASAYHNLYVTMLRRSAILVFIENWRMPAIDPLNPHEAWVSWARYESMKRIPILVYLQDVIVSVFHDLPLLFGDSELDLRLPCDDELWQAPDAYFWARLVTSPASSCPEDVQTRLIGDSFNTVLADILCPLPVVLPAQLDRFSSFIVIHGLLRAIYLSKANDYGERLTIQHALTQWYLGLLSSTSQSRPSGGARPDFTSMVLALYWLAQTWLTHFDSSGHMLRVGQVRFQVTKCWLKDFWLLLHDAGEVGAGVRLMDKPDPLAGYAFVEELPAIEGGRVHAGLLEWIPPR